MGSGVPERGRSRLSSPVAQRAQRRLDKVFDSLRDLPYLREAERRDFLYFKDIFDDALAGIDRKISSGRLRPLDLRGFPQDLRYPGLSARLGVFIGSFDPFQMTHLAIALRFLASEEAGADALFVVPEGADNPAKPLKSDYPFRYEILRSQLAGVFEPLVVPLDLGRGVDTIGIVSRLIDLHRGASLELTHLLGSDSLATAVTLLPEDLEAWGEAARRSGVDLKLSMHVSCRDGRAFHHRYADAIRRLGVGLSIDRTVVGTPSSTAFRTEGAITLVLPTEAVLSRLELLFRYGMARPWTGAPEDAPSPFPGPEYEI
jgi:hypothetical protein